MAKSKDADERHNDIAKFVTLLAQSSEERTLPARERAQLAYALFDGKQDFGPEREEDDSLSKIFLHEFSVIVRTAANIAQQMIFERSDFFGFKAPATADRDFANILEKIVSYYVKQSGFQQKFYEYCLSGGVTGIGIWKLTVEPKLCYRPEYVVKETLKQVTKDFEAVKQPLDNSPIEAETDEERIEAEMRKAVNNIFGAPLSSSREVEVKKRYEFGITLENIDLLNFFFDPDVSDVNNSSYTIERKWKKTYQLAPLVEAGVYDKKKFKKLQTKGFRSGTSSALISSTYEGYAAAQKEQYTNMDVDQPIEILEYFGNYFDLKTGKIIEENVHFVVAGGKVVLKDGKNKYWHQRPPYFTASFSKRPHKPIGNGIADPAINQQMLINELMSAWVDLVKKEVYGVTVADITKLEDPTQLEDGIVPGGVYNALSNPKEVLHNLTFNTNVGNSVIQTVEALKLSGQKGASVDTASSNPTSRSRISATEVAANVNRTNRSEFNLGVTLDTECIEPLINRMLELVFQFAFNSDVLSELNVQGVLTEEEFSLVKGLPAVARYNETRRHYKVEIKGFRAALERNEFLSRSTELLTTLGAIPEARDRVDMGALLEDMLEAYNLDTTRILRQAGPRDKAKEENALLANDQFVSNGENDDDAQELPVHYEQAIKTPNQSIIAHIQGHVQRLSGQGIPVPPPPPELAQIFGPPEQQRLQ